MTDRDKIYEVTGNGQFPFDMLRYDRAWPNSGEDARKIGLTDWLDTVHRSRTVRLHSNKSPTEGRWNSFGWSVEMVSL